MSEQNSHDSSKEASPLSFTDEALAYQKVDATKLRNSLNLHIDDDGLIPGQKRRFNTERSVSCLEFENQQAPKVQTIPIMRSQSQNRIVEVMQRK